MATYRYQRQSESIRAAKALEARLPMDLDRKSSARRRASRKRSFNRGLCFEGLEDRLVLSTITWNTTSYPTGGPWDSPGSWNGGVVPGPSDTAKITGLTSPGTVYLNSNNADSISGLITDSTTTLEIVNGSLSLGAGGSTSLRGQVIVSAGATLQVGTGASVTIGPASSNYGVVTLTDDGTVTFANNDTVTLNDNGYSYGSQVYVGSGGLLQATGASFVATNGNNTDAGNYSQVYVDSGGHLQASGSSFAIGQVYFVDGAVFGAGDLTGNAFNSPLTIPAVNIQYLSGTGSNNLQFQAINLQPDTILNGETVALNVIGTQNTANLRYVIPNGLTVAQGGTLTVAANLGVTIGPASSNYGVVTLTDDGMVTFANNDTVTLNDNGYSFGSQVYVGSGGLLQATGASFVATNGNNTDAGNYSQVYVDSGGHLQASGSSFAIGQVYLADGVVFNAGDLAGNAFNSPLTIPAVDVQYLSGTGSNNLQFQAINLQPDTILNGETVALDVIGTQNTTNLRYIIPSGLTVAQGGTLSVGTDVGLTIGPASNNYGVVTLTDDGTVTFANNDTVTLNDNGYSFGSQVVVGSGGLLQATGASFVATNGNNTDAGNYSQVYVDSGGHLQASGSSFAIGQVYLADGVVFNAGDLAGNAFNSPLTIPAIDIQYLSGTGSNNLQFQAINLQPDTIIGGEAVALDVIGTQNTANLHYYIPSGLTVAQGGTLAVAANLGVTIGPATSNYGVVTLTDDGTVTFATDDTVTLDDNGYAYGAQIVVGSGGLLQATGASFVATNGNGTDAANYSQVVVDSGGHLQASGSTFNIGQVYLADGVDFAAGDLTGNAFNSPLYIPAVNVQYLSGTGSNNLQFQGIYLQPDTIIGGEAVALDVIGTQNTANLHYYIPSGLTVAQGGTLAVAANLGVTIGPATSNYGVVTLTDDGTATFATDDTVTLDDNGYAYGAQVVVGSGGLLQATGASFVATNGNGTDAANYSQVVVNSGGHLQASGSSFAIGQVYYADGVDFAAGDLSGNAFNSPLTIPAIDVQYLSGTGSNNLQFQVINLQPDTILSGETVALNVIGTQNTSNLRYAIPSGLTVAQGGTLAVAADVSLTIGPASSNYGVATLADNGTATFATNDTVTFDDNGYAYGAQIVVGSGGLLQATGASFVATNGNGTDAANYSQVVVDSGGHLQASDSTFAIGLVNLNNSVVLNSGDLSNNIFATTLATPIGDVPLLTANQSFQIVAINTGSLTTNQSVTLNLMGTVTSVNLLYVFTGALTVNAGATLDFGYGVNVQINNGVTITDSGTMNISDANAVVAEDTNSNYTEGIVVNGILDATGASLTRSGTDNTSYIQVNSGGQFTDTNDAFGWYNLDFNSDSTDTLEAVAFSGKLAVNSGAIIGTLADPTITGDNFTNVGADGIVASGDPNASIPFAGNYWGTTVIAQIAAKIDDHNVNSNLPTVVYQPFVSNASGTSATPATAVFSPTDQTINLSATVSTTAGVAINEGTETFTILNGTQVIGQTTAPANVSEGLVTAVYTLPGNTPAGQYIIEASYSGTANYLPSTDMLHFLTVTPAPTVTTVADASAIFLASANQSIPLTAQVSSTAGTVNEGTVTFTILSNGSPVGSSVSAGVTDDAASATYTLLAGTAGGAYTIQAAYSDPIDFSASTGTNSLTLSAASTTIVPSDSTATYSATTSEGITLSANVTSSAGTINQGSVTFTILNSAGAQVVPPIVVSVLNGVASSNYSLPAGTGVGTLTIEAVYDGTASYAASLSANSTLTISGATTATTASSTSIGYNSAAQSVPLVASVTSPGGIVNGGTVTFTIYSGSTPVGSSVNANVSSGTTSASYPLPPGAAIGTYTIEAVYTATSDFGGSSDITHSLTITQPPASQWVIQTEPSTSATAGQAFATEPVVYEEDQFGNLITSDNSSVVTATLGSGSGPLQGTVTATVVAGVATFTNLADDKAETITLAFSGDKLAPATSTSIVVNPAAASQLVVTQQPSYDGDGRAGLRDPAGRRGGGPVRKCRHRRQHQHRDRGPGQPRHGEPARQQSNGDPRQGRGDLRRTVLRQGRDDGYRIHLQRQRRLARSLPATSR